MEKKTYYIYAHINIFNKKAYIGQTSRKPEYRWNHGKGYKNQDFYQAIQEFGWDNFKHIILEENIPEEKVNEREKYWIKYYDSCNNGYNKTYGGSCHQQISEDTRKKISEKGKGRIVSEETRKKISEGLKGKTLSEEHRQHLSESHIGKKLSEEIKQKMRENNTANVSILCIETNQIFCSASEAARWCGLKDGSHILGYCKGEGQSAGKHPITKEKLHWKILEKENINEERTENCDFKEQVPDFKGKKD